MPTDPKTRDDKWLGSLTKGMLVMYEGYIFEVDAIDKVGYGKYVRLLDPITKDLFRKDVCIVELREPDVSWTLLIVAGKHKEAMYWMNQIRLDGFENPMLYMRKPQDALGRSPISTRWVRVGSGAGRSVGSEIAELRRRRIIEVRLSDLIEQPKEAKAD